MLPNRRQRHLPTIRRGMTLLELVLSLALSALLLMAVSMALHIHWRAFDVKRSRVEEAQLASAILRNISDDIRGTLKFEPPNLEGLNLTSLAANALGSAAGGALPDSGGGGQGEPDVGGPDQPENPDDPPNPTTPGPDENDGMGNPDEGTPSGGAGTGGTTTGTPTSTSPDASAESETAASAGPSVVVGLYGSATQLQFDISRLPRVDQYQSQESEDGSTQIPSDIKTVVYFLAEEGAASGDAPSGMTATSQPSTSGTGRGLMRAESDRAVSAYGEVNGSTDSLFAGARLLAAEVTSIQFQYFDGTEWLAEWNSDEQGGLPTAIEVLLTIDSPHVTASTAPLAAAPGLTESDGTTQPTHRMVVHLPVGGISPSTEESSETTEATDPAGGAMDTGSFPPEAMP